MLLISSRKNFWDDNRVSEKDKILDFNLETLEKSQNPVNTKEFIKRIKGKKILLLIHGYNNKEHRVIGAYKTIAEHANKLIQYKDNKYYDLIIGYTWPGGDDFTDYFEAKNRLEKIVSTSVKPLITDMIEHCKEVDIMAHSLGCRISLMVMSDLQKNHFSRGDISIRLYLLAAAVDNDSIEKGETFYEGSNYCDNTYIFHSKYDQVLRVINIQDMLQWLLKGGWIYPWKEKNDALGYSGPENPDPTKISPKVKVINCKKTVKNHGDYKDDDLIYTYIKNELTSGDSDKASQFSTL